MSELMRRTYEVLANGLYNKYRIAKFDGTAVDPKARYFVLRLDEHCKDKHHLAACRKAVLVYAEAIEHHLPNLAADLRRLYGKEAQSHE